MGAFFMLRSNSSLLPDAAEVRAYLLGLQERVCAGLEIFEGENGEKFLSDAWSRGEGEGGGGVTRVLEGGAVFEKAGVAFSHVRGAALPASASERRPEVAGKAWEAMGVSIVVHPRNPHVPASHANVRFFVADKDSAKPAWWFGGGFDLTPFYGYEEDAREWHAAARDALAPFGDGYYRKFKKNCDEYFFLKHRGEARGVGGVFFDDFSELGAEQSFALMRAVGDAFAPAYAKIIERRKDAEYGEREREFQLYRRGRYAEFNLVWDRGTHFGLQSGGRTESILMSMPPLARWDYARTWEAGSAEARLTEYFLKAREWV